MVALLLATAVMAACGDDGEDVAGTTTTTRPTTTSSTATTEPEDPWAVPEDIDEAYVQRVLTELYRLDGEARRIAVREGMVTEEVIELVQRVYAPKGAAERGNELIESSIDRFPGVHDPPGDVRLTVQQIELQRQDAPSPRCVVVSISADFTAVVENGSDDLRYFVELVEGEGNETGWLIRNEAVRSDGSRPDNMDCR